MKQGSDKVSTKRNGYQSDDDTVRYKINTKHINNIAKTNIKSIKKVETKEIEDDDDVRYRLPTSLPKSKSPEKKPKPKSKIKVNFWSNKQNVKRLQGSVPIKEKTNRRHTVGSVSEVSPATKSKTSSVKVRKRVSFLPSPLFSDNHVPMVTVPDDLTIQLNEEEANDLSEDLNHAFVNSDSGISDTKSDYNVPNKKARNSMTQTSSKRKRSNDDITPTTRIPANDNELEFFSKYVVQKLRRMETNQRIYSENLINTVLMLGQLGKLNGKSKIGET